MDVVAGELLDVDEVVHVPHLLHVDPLRQQDPVVLQLRHERAFHMANLNKIIIPNSNLHAFILTDLVHDCLACRLPDHVGEVHHVLGNVE